MPQLCKLFLNDTSEEHYNGNWVYINLSQLQSSEDVRVVNKVILFEVLYYILAKQDSKVEYSTRGMVHAWVAQKRLKRDILRLFTMSDL